MGRGFCFHLLLVGFPSGQQVGHHGEQNYVLGGLSWPVPAGLFLGSSGNVIVVSFPSQGGAVWWQPCPFPLASSTLPQLGTNGRADS